MGNFTWEGWQTSAEDAPQPTSILFGKNLKTSSSNNPRELNLTGSDSESPIPERFKTIDPDSIAAKIAQELCDSLNATVLKREKERDKTKSQEE